MHRTYLLNEHIFNDEKGKGFNDTSIWNLKSNILYWEVETQKKDLMGNKIVNNGGKLSCLNKRGDTPF
jgi:hypothetical protein